jgi:hypothetical protein
LNLIAKLAILITCPTSTLEATRRTNYIFHYEPKEEFAFSRHPRPRNRLGGTSATFDFFDECREDILGEVDRKDHLPRVKKVGCDQYQNLVECFG